MPVEPFGWNEAAEKIRKFGRGQDEDVEKVLDSAANVYIDAVKEIAPRSGQSRGEGTYRNSIKVLAGGKGFRIVGSDKIVTSLSNGKWYNLGSILENGSSKHIIEGNPLMWTGGKYGTGFHFAMRVQHPGTRPQPHFKPAIEKLKPKFPNIYLQITERGWK